MKLTIAICFFSAILLAVRTARNTDQRSRFDTRLIATRDFRRIEGPMMVKARDFRRNEGPMMVKARDFRRIEGPMMVKARDFRRNEGPMMVATRDIRRSEGPMMVTTRDFRRSEGPLATIRNVRGDQRRNEEGKRFRVISAARRNEIRRVRNVRNSLLDLPEKHDADWGKWSVGLAAGLLAWKLTSNGKAM